MTATKQGASDWTEREHVPVAPRKPLMVNLAWAAALVVMLAVGYAASSGPVCVWAVSNWSKVRSRSETVDWVYTPLGWITSRSPTIHAVHDKWVDWCFRVLPSAQDEDAPPLYPGLGNERKSW